MRAVILTVLVIFLCNWYIGYPDPTDVRQNVEQELSVVEARARWTNTDPNKKYKEVYTLVVNRKRTLVPFVYTRDTLSKGAVTLKITDTNK